MMCTRQERMVMEVWRQGRDACAGSCGREGLTQEGGEEERIERLCGGRGGSRWLWWWRKC